MSGRIEQSGNSESSTRHCQLVAACSHGVCSIMPPEGLVRNDHVRNGSGLAGEWPEIF